MLWFDYRSCKKHDLYPETLETDYIETNSDFDSKAYNSSGQNNDQRLKKMKSIIGS